MVFNSLLMVSVAHKSAEAWQQISCIRLQDRLSSHQLLDLLCCFPLQQLGRFALCLCTFLCLPSRDSFYAYPYYSSSSSDDDDDDDGGGGGRHNHRFPNMGRGSSSASSSSPSLNLDDYYIHSHSD